VYRRTPSPLSRWQRRRPRPVFIDSGKWRCCFGLSRGRAVCCSSPRAPAFIGAAARGEPKAGIAESVAGTSFQPPRLPDGTQPRAQEVFTSESTSPTRGARDAVCDFDAFPSMSYGRPVRVDLAERMGAAPTPAVMRRSRISFGRGRGNWCFDLPRRHGGSGLCTGAARQICSFHARPDLPTAHGLASSRCR
jgi:hypothetical protein